jgi:7-carboxy-7-deazaguanine synthase
MKVASLPVVEIFHSIQGEGIRSGEMSTFIRFAGCNLRCSWCDTPYSWSAEGVREAEKFELEQLAEQVRESSVVLTGGEPMLHARRLGALIEAMRASGVNHITVETNATIFDRDLADKVDLWSLSPKLAGSGEVPDPECIRSWIEAARDRMQLKFVIADSQSDWAAMWALLEETGLPADVPLLVQPDGLRDDYDVALRELAELVAADTALFSESPRRARVRVTPQVHRIAWGAFARGV